MVVVLKSRAQVFASPPATLADWQALVTRGGLATLANSDVLAAIDRWKAQERELSDALYQHLARSVAGILRRMISRKLVDDGIPAIERAAALIANAIRNPGHKHGGWIRKNFSQFVRWRTLSVLRKWRKEVGPAGSSLDDGERLPALLARHRDRLSDASHEDAVIAAIDRERLRKIIEKIEDPKKRLVLLLSVIHGDTGAEAAKAADVLPGTARKWIRIFKRQHEVDDRDA